jgi:hypothetical protein
MQLTKSSDRAAMVFALWWYGGLNLHEKAGFLSWNCRGRLISLFDIVKEFLAHAVFSDGRRIQKLASFMEGINKPKAHLKEGHCTDLTEVMTRIRSGCEYLDLPASKQSCDELVKALSKRSPMPISGEIQSLLTELVKRIEVELKAHTYLCVSRDDAGFYHKPLDGWVDTITAFPSTRYDIEEASKCLALQRNTGAVFHLMRVMGTGVKAIGKSLNEKTLDASHNLTWDNVLRRCAKESEKEFKDMSPVWQGDKKFFATATAKLYAVKDAWRNPNAHEIGDKYTSEETLDIYRTIRSFMRQLATKLKETP